MSWQNLKIWQHFFEELYVCTQNVATLMSRKLQESSIKPIPMNCLTPRGKQLGRNYKWLGNKKFLNIILERIFLQIIL
jgi:hypothetical protein